MSSWMRIVMFGSISVLVFDLIAASASRFFGFPYVRATIGSFLIYGAVGYVVARTATQNTLPSVLLAGMVIGLIDATLGWGVSWFVGPGRPKTQLTPARWFMTALIVMATSSLLAITGAAIARLVSAKRIA
jgi:hypothetical protein